MKYIVILALLIAGVGFYISNKKGKVADTDVKVTPAAPLSIYHDPGNAYSIQYPQEFSLDTLYRYQLTPTAVIPGIKLTIPEAMAAGTNLSQDSFVSVELLADENNCSANRFLNGTYPETSEIYAGKTFSVASSSDAGAGNRYEEKIYALSGGDDCIAVRYFIHSTVLENYEPGTVLPFNQSALLSTFDRIRNSLTVQ